MVNGAFLDSSILHNAVQEEAIKYDVKKHRITFEFPEGFTQIRLIEECRAMNALDVSDPDNFDLLYDITMQMINGKPVFIYYNDDTAGKTEIGRFVVTSRYMDLRTVDIIDEYPILVNWLVEFVSAMLAKKYPRSLKDIQAAKSAREERLKSLKQTQEEVIRASFLMQ